MTTTLKDLVGLHKLNAVDFERVSVPRWEGADPEDFEDASCCRFRLDGTVWAAVEDPSDGYRSSMKSLMHQPKAKMVNVFAAIQVVGVYRNRHGYQESDLIEFIDIHTGKVVLEIGTRNTDDYYPSFVASFSPENMKLNAA